MKTRGIVATLLFVAFGLVLGAPAQAQRPPGKHPRKAQGAAKQTTKQDAAALQNAAQDMEQGVVRIPAQYMPQDPLQLGIHNAIQKAIQEAKRDPKTTPAEIQAMENAPGYAPQNVVPNASQYIQQNALQNTAPSTVSKTGPLMPQDTTPSANAKHPTKTARAPAIPTEFQDGITALQNAQKSLQSAGQKWGGHKQKAVAFINQALAACGQPRIPLQEAAAAPADQSAAMQDAFTQLTNAKNVFANATNEWDGRRDQAIEFLNQALSEVQASIDFAKSHNTF